ncbi:NADH-quinone oxidoreductase subunit NuoG [Thermomonas hydrothermalis]|uniref:NADH-quinone oxidoreductase n=1 Tax=Thermomonas hydrothermalis TaxID=213588 RepID=A0A1M4SXQ2_9GAMM|nr:NADH-quinone oxidoreductase subunit NuoG [Thermomonas hydrothermalis]SHE36797.1 NADH-quinone oxidoreductase subunit G [Thermomonas hydrothermalis]
MSAQPVNPNLPPDHVTVFIDGVELAAPKGAMIIQVADKAGIPIPRFCYHEKLPIAANCRMCLVDTEIGGRPAPKPSPACATPVMDGMRVFTRNEKALKAQRNVMEFLLINHPLDCPICDQGGECELQDLSLGYGRSVSRFVERKRVVPDEDLGPLVATEMTRCIQCTRCVRFTAEIAGTYELGGMQRGENLQIGTYDGQPLMTELSGNVIDVCPVGALTNKVYRFKARPWELIARPSLGYHDALGSNLFHHVRRGELLRSVPRDNEAVNECWLSDRDRYAHEGLYAEDRATVPLIRDGDGFREASWDEALARVADILKAHAGDALGVLVHPATSNEEGALLARLAEGLGSGNLDHRIGQLDLSDGAHADAFGMPVAEIEHADAIVIVGSNIRHEVPLLHQRIRKAVKRGAKVHVVNPVDFDFTFAITGKHIVPPSRIAATLAQLEIGEAARSAVIVGAVAENGPYAAAIRKAAAEFAAAKNAKLCRIPQGANALGLSRQGVLPRGLDAQAMLRAPRQAYLLYGIEPGLDFADQPAALKALGAARVVALSHFACASTRAVAEVILPIGLLPEIDATLTNLDGLEQQAVAAARLPGQARPGWKVLRALGGLLALKGFEFTDLDGLRAEMTARPVHVAGNGAAPAAEATAAHGLELAVSPAIYRVDAVIRRATALQLHPLNAGPHATLNPADASALGLMEGAMARFATAAGSATLPVKVDARVAQGCVWIESGHGATAPLLASARLEVAAV